MTVARGLAVLLAAHAAAVMPHAQWSEAMRREVEEIESDRDALDWALGCLLASYKERTMSVLQTRAVRWPFAVLVLMVAGRELFAPTLTLAYKLGNLPLAQFLGSFTPGDDYRRFVPLMDATPLWVMGAWTLSGVLSIASALTLLWKMRLSFVLFIAAILVEIAGTLVSRQMPAYHAAFAFPSFLWMRDVVIPAAQLIIPMLMAIAMWAMTERGAAPTPN